jgi:hypothetical protein
MDITSFHFKTSLIPSRTSVCAPEDTLVCVVCRVQETGFYRRSCDGQSEVRVGIFRAFSITAMDPLSILPPELTLRILSTLAVPEITALQASSKQWNNFISVHEDAVYRTVASYLPAVSLSELCRSKAANTVEPEYWSNIETWKQYCAYGLRFMDGFWPTCCTLQVPNTFHYAGIL